jgi:hypothetical protein
MPWDSVLIFLTDHGASEAVHSSSSFLGHLVGTATLLQSWGGPSYLQLAGLCHAVYGTASYTPPNSLVIPRHVVREVAGAAAERLVFLFCGLRRDARWRAAVASAAALSAPSTFEVTHRDRATLETISRAELSDLASLVLANALEQAPRVSHLYDTDMRESLACLLDVALPGARNTFHTVFALPTQ